MHLGLKQLAQFFIAHRDEPRLVLATVIATEGSTYRKAGAMMLVSPDGNFAGMISGGCLEDDLVRHADAVFQDGEARRISYDLHDDEELVLSLGLGCGGDVHILLQGFDRDDEFGVLSPLFRAIDEREHCLLSLVTTGAGLQPGTMALTTSGGKCWGDQRLAEYVAENLNPDAMQGRSEVVMPTLEGVAHSVLVTRIEPSPLVLLCGAGPDAVPLASQVAALGWDCVVADHRPAYADPARFPEGTHVLATRPENLASELDLSTLDAAVVMTHHVGHDATCLEQLLRQPPAYLGLLGPASRRIQLAGQLDAPPGSIRGPAGLDIGGELPESIALSIMAEIHAVLNGRNAREQFTNV
jgi:xanthine dehydrogenase accessory factor